MNEAHVELKKRLKAARWKGIGPMRQAHCLTFYIGNTYHSFGLMKDATGWFMIDNRNINQPVEQFKKFTSLTDVRRLKIEAKKIAFALLKDAK